MVYKHFHSNISMMPSVQKRHFEHCYDISSACLYIYIYIYAYLYFQDRCVNSLKMLFEQMKGFLFSKTHCWLLIFKHCRYVFVTSM